MSLSTSADLNWFFFWGLDSTVDGMAVFQAVKHHQEQIEEARRLHHQDLKASVSLHNHEIEVENKMHRQEVKLACKLHDREKEMALAMHNIALQVRAKPTPQNPLPSLLPP